MATALTNEEVRSEATRLFHKELFERVSEAYEDFREQNNISQAIYAQVNITNGITDEQTDMAMDEFLDEYTDIQTQDEVSEAVRNYISENYDPDFLLAQVENKYDMDTVHETASDELILLLHNTEPYGDATDGYWEDKVRTSQIQTFELAKFATEDGVQSFVEEYAPDWENEALEPEL